MSNVRLSKEMAEELMIRGLKDPVYFCRMFLPEWFPKPMPWVHRGILALMSRQTDFLLNFGTEQWRDGSGAWTLEGLRKIYTHFVWQEDPEDKDSPKRPLFVPVYGANGEIESIDLMASRTQLEIMPRGFSKTTLANGEVTRKIVYRLTKFLVYVSESSTHAEAQLDNIATQLELNPLLREVFGNLVPERNHPNPWRSDEKHTLNDIWMVARGRGGQVRGLNRNARRPDFILVDDVENEESVATKEQRAKTIKWMASAVMPALPRMNPNAFMQVLGTMLDKEAMLPTLAKDPSVVSVTFGAVDPDGEMLWDDNMNRTQYEAMKRSYRSIGQSNVFSREYDSKITNEEDKVFDLSGLAVGPRALSDFVVRALVIDPAISDNPKADFCSFAVVGIDDKGFIHVLESYSKRGMSPREQVDKYFELKFQYQTHLNGVEAISYQKALVHLLREEMFRKSKLYGSAAYFEIAEIKHNSDQDKIKRVQGVLAPRYSAGYITHQKHFPELETQLDEWPTGKKDAPDAVAMAITLLDPHAGLALGDDADGKVPGEDRWEEDEDWRTAV